MALSQPRVPREVPTGLVTANVPQQGEIYYSDAIHYVHNHYVTLQPPPHFQGSSVSLDQASSHLLEGFSKMTP